MTKLLVVLLVVAVALWALLKRSNGRRGRGAGPVEAPPSEAPRASQDMVRCAHCGLHLPAPDAVQAGGRTYCSAEHAAAGSRPA